MTEISLIVTLNSQFNSTTYLNKTLIKATPIWLVVRRESRSCKIIFQKLIFKLCRPVLVKNCAPRFANMDFRIWKLPFWIVFYLTNSDFQHWEAIEREVVILRKTATEGNLICDNVCRLIRFVVNLWSKYNAFQLSAKIFSNLQLFICVEPIIAMFRNERNWVGGAITESYRGQ